MADNRYLFDCCYEPGQLGTSKWESYVQPVFHPGIVDYRQEQYRVVYRKRTLHQQFESYKQEVRRIGADTRRQQTQHKDDAPTCGICRKTKFADGCGHLCSYCQTKFCARCGGRVSLRSNN
ncbi:regulating synaptic membrane exocytosis protein 1-like, partial [Osmerus eperlanus]|uniref:regulating synaptic membrane exocytosis protein 1-like n=1 Tax=Osmerus eperlanus TaxID=29151 RepID=UPI002E138897